MWEVSFHFPLCLSEAETADLLAVGTVRYDDTGFLQFLQSEILVSYKLLKHSVCWGKNKSTALNKALTLGSEIPVSDAVSSMDLMKRQFQKIQSLA